MASGTGNPDLRLAQLEAVLEPLLPALERLHQAQLEQRRVVVAGDLGGIVVATTTLEETSARVALLEQRRQAIQTELEAEFGVQGLRAVLVAAAIPPADRARLGQLLGQVSRLVRDLRDQGNRNAELLSAAIDVAHRTRKIVERRSGADSIYDPVKARRQMAARRGHAGLTTTVPTVRTGRVPGQPEEDGASSAHSKEAP
ncbi:MAG: flagellar export chaperone FlgN [Chloroflexota bacterium]